MCPICTTPLLLCLIHLDVRYVERIHIQTLDLEKKVIKSASEMQKIIKT